MCIFVFFFSSEKLMHRRLEVEAYFEKKNVSEA